jgi:hypothetical protein
MKNLLAHFSFTFSDPCSPQFKVQSLISKSAQGQMRLLGMDRLCLKTLNQRKKLSTHTHTYAHTYIQRQRDTHIQQRNARHRQILNTQHWIGIEKPQMTFPFKNGENGRHMAVIGP